MLPVGKVRCYRTVTFPDIPGQDRSVTMVSFFIHRPIFASSIAVIMVLAGAICYFLLPVSQFPDITPPQVVVSAVYPGASAQVVADTVTTPLEQQINGV